MAQITKAQAEQVLRDESNGEFGLDGYDETYLGFVSDGVEWMLLEDSMDLLGSQQWLASARGYGEIAAVYHWIPQD